MKQLFLILLVLALAVWAGLVMRQDPGMIVMTFADWRVDAPLWLGLIALLIGYFLVHYLIVIITDIIYLPDSIRKLVVYFRRKRARRLTRKGFVALAEGNYPKAEQALIKGAPYSEQPWMNYISAAKAAQEQGAEVRRNEYLQRAQEITPDTDIAVSLTQATLQFEQKEFDQCQVTLATLERKAPHHPAVLKLQASLHMQRREWEPLSHLLGVLERYHAFPKAELRRIELLSWYHILIAAKGGSLDALQTIWRKMPKSLHPKDAIAYAYAKGLIAHQQFSEAEDVISHALKHHWQEALIRLYGHAADADPQAMLTKAEKWLKVHPESSDLFFTLGRLCEKLQLWGKAQRYLEASLTIRPDPQTYAQLGILLERMNKPELGAQYFKKGLLLATPIHTDPLHEFYT